MFGNWAMRGLGGLLLLAAGLKMYGLAVEPVGRAGIFSEPWVQTLIVEWEIALGIWLVWGVNRSLAWFAATATFLAFAGFSSWQGWIGQTNCGCFGAIRVNPWIAFGIDVVAIGMLASGWRHSLRARTPSQLATTLRPLMIGGCGVVAILGILAGIGTAGFGSPYAALAYLRGERLSVEPRLIDFGEGYLGEQKQVVIQLRNWTDHPIRVLGGTSDCSCVVTGDLPATIQPGERYPLTVRLTIMGQPGQYTRAAQLYTDDVGFRLVTFRLTGRSYALSEESALAEEQ